MRFNLNDMSFALFCLEDQLLVFFASFLEFHILHLLRVLFNLQVFIYASAQTLLPPPQISPVEARGFVRDLTAAFLFI